MRLEKKKTEKHHENSSCFKYPKQAQVGTSCAWAKLFFANPGLNDACGDTYLTTGQSWLGRCACRLPYRPTEPWHRQLFRCALLAAGQVAPYPCVFSLGTVLYVPCTFWLYICLPRTPVCEVTLTPVSEVGGTLGTCSSYSRYFPFLLPTS